MKRQRTKGKNTNKSYNALQNKKNVITLIRFYRGHECLWNPQNPDYHNTEKTNIMWNWIAKQFGNSVQKKDVIIFLKKLQEDVFYKRNVWKKCLQSGVPYEGDDEYIKEFEFLDTLIVTEKHIGKHKKKVQLPPEPMPCHATALKKERRSLPLSSLNTNYDNKLDINKIDISSDVNILCDGIRNKLCSMPLNVFSKTQKQILKIISQAHTDINNEDLKSSKL